MKIHTQTKNEFQSFLHCCGEAGTGRTIPELDYCILKNIFMAQNNNLTRIQKIGAIYEFETEIRDLKCGPRKKYKTLVTLPDGTKEIYDSIWKAAEVHPVASYSNISYYLKVYEYHEVGGISFKKIKSEEEENEKN